MLYQILLLYDVKFEIYPPNAAPTLIKIKLTQKTCTST